MISREIRLASRPDGWPTPKDFALADVELPSPAQGQVLVRNRFISVDPYMRGRMSDARSYVAPFQIGEVLQGHAVGEVVETRAPALAPGTIVTSMLGWREAFVAGADDVQPIVEPLEPLSLYLGVLGMPGFTAWAGLNLVNVGGGDRVFVSGAAGAVGSTAGQLAKLRGCSIVGSAGSAAKVRALVDELGFDAAFNYKDGHLPDQLKQAAPDGIDVYFDNVGGDHLEAALSALRPFGRIIACGAISRYNETEPPPGPRNLGLVVTKRLTLRGFIISDSRQQLPQFLQEVTPLVAGGRLRALETVREGIEHAPQAFIDMMRGANLGKMVVRV